MKKTLLVLIALLMLTSCTAQKPVQKKNVAETAITTTESISASETTTSETTAATTTQTSAITATPPAIKHDKYIDAALNKSEYKYIEDSIVFDGDKDGKNESLVYLKKDTSESSESKLWFVDSNLNAVSVLDFSAQWQPTDCFKVLHIGNSDFVSFYYGEWAVTGLLKIYSIDSGKLCEVFSGDTGSFSDCGNYYMLTSHSYQPGPWAGSYELPYFISYNNGTKKFEEIKPTKFPIEKLNEFKNWSTLKDPLLKEVKSCLNSFDNFNTSDKIEISDVTITADKFVDITFKVTNTEANNEFFLPGKIPKNIYLISKFQIDEKNNLVNYLEPEYTDNYWVVISHTDIDDFN